MTRFGLLAVAGALCACSGEAPSAVGVPLEVRTGALTLCDAGDEAFVKRLIPLMWGRRPASIREVDVLVQVVQATDRATLARAMTRTVEYRERWEDFLRDALWVNRAGERARRACYGDRLRTPVDAGLAEYVRDHPPAASDAPVEPWTMSDLVHSALVLDDLSPVYLAQLFAQAGTATFVVVEDPFDEQAVRVNFTNIFERTYLHRRMECLACHNSGYAVTDAVDPALDRHWPIPGFWELALYGDHQGRARADLHPFFRTGGLLTLEPVPWEGMGQQEYELVDTGVAPWGVAFACGRFHPQASIAPDPLGESMPYLGGEVGPTASVWDVEERLRIGFDGLRAPSFAAPDPDGPQEVDGREALAWLVAVNVAEQVWAEAFGARLSSANYFPRNSEQRELQQWLATTFVAEGFSLRELLVAVVTHPYFAQAPPAACGEAASPYNLGAVFDPFTSDDEDPARRWNGVGDIVHRLAPRVLVNSARFALGWSGSEEWFEPPDDDDEEDYVLPPAGRLQRDIGYFLKDTEIGFRGIDFQTALTWEDAFARCRSPDGGEDWIDALVVAAGDATIEEAARALKDRLLTDPTISAAELEQVQALMEVPMPTRVAEMPAAADRLRWLCGALLASPQFVLAGDPGPDRLDAPRPAVVVEGASFGELCAQHAEALFAPGGMTCENGAVSVVLGGGDGR